MINKTMVKRFYFLIIFVFLMVPSYISILNVPIGKVALLCLLLLSLICFLLEGDYKLTLDVNSFLFCAFLFFFIISSIFSESYEGVARRGIVNGVGLFSLYYLSRYLKNSEFFLKSFVRFLGFILIANYAVILVELYLGIQLSSFLPIYLGVDLKEWAFIAEEKVRSGNIRYQGLFSHPLILSVISSLVLFTLIDNKYYKVFFRFVLAFVAIHSILLSDSRAGFVTILIFPLIYGLGKNNRFLYYVIAIILGLLWSLFFTDSVVDILNSLTGNDIQTKNSTDNRLLQLEEAASLFYVSNSALLLGFGSESAPELMKYGTIDNLFLSTFLEVGLVGFFIFLFMNVRALFRVLSACDNLMLALFLVALLYALILSLFQFLFLYTLVLALVVTNENSTNP